MKKVYILGIVTGLLLSLVTAYAIIKYQAEDVGYTPENSNFKVDNVRDAIENLYTNCTSKMIFKIGDYVQMTPTVTSFTTDKNYTGYSEPETIKPQELNLWRVIYIHKDGTVDMVSEYASSTKINFSGVTGYKNYTGYLNILAKQYENKKYTIDSRNTGYAGQTEFITDTSAFNVGVKTAPWSCSTGGDCGLDETRGAGDTLYQTDWELIRSAVGRTRAYLVNDKTNYAAYFLSSRRYELNSSGTFYFDTCVVQPTTDSAICYWISASIYNGLGYRNSVGNLRPIVTLKANVIPSSGEGTSEKPYILN